jgi:hypothetical protein
MPKRVEVGRSKAKEVTVSSRRAHEAGRILLQVRFVCDGSNSSGRDNTRNLSYWQSGHWQRGRAPETMAVSRAGVSILHRKKPRNP